MVVEKMSVKGARVLVCKIKLQGREGFETPERGQKGSFTCRKRIGEAGKRVVGKIHGKNSQQN